MKPRFWVLLALATGVRLYFSSMTGLSDDEAYYWEWSRHLNWSYYDHPGMTAWLIYLSEKIFGSSPFSVRLPALVLNTGTLLGIGVLAKKFFGSLAAFWVTVLYLLIPLYSLGGLMMVPDVPMSFFWILTVLVYWETVIEEEIPPFWGWTTMGILMGLGTLSKYPMVLLGFSLFIFTLVTPQARKQLKTSGPWFAVLLWALFLTPIFIWNLQNHGASIQFQVSGRLSSKDPISLARWGAFWGSQLALLTPAVFFLLAGCAFLSVREFRNLKWRYLACVSLPTLGIFALQALKTEFKPHWPAPGYVGLLIGSGFFFTEIFPRWNKWTRYSSVFFAGLFLLPINFLLFTGMISPIIPKIYRQLSIQAPWDPRWDPTNDLFGWPEAGRYTLDLQKQYFQTTGAAPFVATHRYQLSSGLAFGTHSRIWTLPDGMDGYLFLQTPEEISNLMGLDAIVVGDNRYEDNIHQRGIFESCEALPPFSVLREGELARTFEFWICKKLKKPGIASGLPTTF